jgi:hypothetical protein
MADLGTGFRRLPKPGNAGLRRSWTINHLQRGTYFWTVQAVDHSFAGSPFAPVQTFMVTNILDTPTNDPPFAQDLSVTTPEDTAVNVTLVATDVDSLALIYTVLTPPSHGVLSGTPPSLIYTPTTNYFGLDSFTFEVSDGQLHSGPATITITTLPVNDPPVARAGPDQSVDCAGPLTAVMLDGRDSTDVEGQPLSYSWREGNTVLGASAMLQVGLSRGAHIIILEVTDPNGAAAQDTVLVNVVDVTSPAITCPDNISVEFNSEAGAWVTFTPAATDLCSVVTIVCSPPSGSTFAIGTTNILCTATDASGNAESCSFLVTVLGAQSLLQNVLAELGALRAAVTNRDDARRLDDAIQHLTASLLSELWIDPTHLERQVGDKVFHELRGAVHQLRELIQDKNSSMADVPLRGFIDRLVRAARLLAVVSIQDAAAAGLNPAKIAEDNAEMAKGDDDVNEGKFESAIDHYRNAWKHAVHLKIKASLAPSGNVRLAFVSGMAENYVIQASTNLMDWVTLDTPTVGSDGVITIDDAGVDHSSARFYRIMSP